MKKLCGWFSWKFQGLLFMSWTMSSCWYFWLVQLPLALRAEGICPLLLWADAHGIFSFPWLHALASALIWDREAQESYRFRVSLIQIMYYGFIDYYRWLMRKLQNAMLENSFDHVPSWENHTVTGKSPKIWFKCSLGRFLLKWRRDEKICDFYQSSSSTGLRPT